MLGITVFGLLLNDFNFIFVTLFFRHLPGNYWFLLVGPVVEGCVGGQYRIFLTPKLPEM